MRSLVFGALGAACAATIVAAQVQNTAALNPRDLRPLASFSGIGDQAERTRALFNEIAAPGNQKQLGEPVQAWIDTGAQWP